MIWLMNNCEYFPKVSTPYNNEIKVWMLYMPIESFFLSHPGTVNSDSALPLKPSSMWQYVIIIKLYSPLSTTFSTRDRHQGGALVVPLVDGFTAVFVRKIFTVWFSITVKGLTNAAPWVDNDTVSLTQIYIYCFCTEDEHVVQVVVIRTYPFLCRWSSLHNNLAPDTVRLHLDISASPTVSQCTLCHQTVMASPSIGNGTRPEFKMSAFRCFMTENVRKPWPK